MKRICIYHAGCPDGFGAAWAVWKSWEGDGTFVARGHEDRVKPDQFEDALVAFVDIAPHNDELCALAERAARVVVLDHHVTARDRFEEDPETARALEQSGHEILFDMDHSGAVLSWNYFNADVPIPDLLRYVEDQDLWSWALPDSDAVNAAIASYPHTFETWSALAGRPIAELVAEGEPILRANRVEVERIVRKAAPLAIGARRVESVNSATNRSAIGHALAERKAYGERWGCVYRIDGARVHATLYSIGDFDVSQIATKLDGGGHKNAAGFTVPLDEWVRDFVC